MSRDQEGVDRDIEKGRDKTPTLNKAGEPIAVLGKGSEAQIMVASDGDEGNPRGDKEAERYQASRRYPVLRRGLVGHRRHAQPKRRSMLARRGRPGSHLRVRLAKTGLGIH